MADQKINIAIGSSYNGTGMNNALGAVDKLSKTAGKAAGAVGSLGSALGGMGGKAGQAIGAVTKLTGALAMGGPIGLAIAGVTALVAAFQNYKEKQEQAAKAAQEHAKKLKELQAEAEKKAWKAFVDDLARGRTEATNMATALEKVVNLEKALAQAKQSNANATANLEQAELAAATAAKARAESTPEGKALAQASGNVAMSRLRGQTSVSNAQANLSSATSTLQSSEAGYNAMVEVYDALERQAQELEQKWKEQNEDKIEEVRLLETTNAETLSAVRTDAQIAEELMKQDANYQKRLKAIRDEQASVNAKITESGLRVATLREQQEAAEKALTQAKVQAAADEAAAIEAEKQAREAKLVAEDKAIGERLAAEEKIAQTKLEQEIAEAKYLGDIEEKERNERQAAKNAEEMKTLDEAIKIAKQDLADAIKRTGRAYDASRAIAANGIYNPNGAATGGRRNARRGASANNTDNAGFTDFAKAEGWDARWAQTHQAQAAALGIQAGLSKKEQREYGKLQDKWNGNPEGMSDSELKRFKELRDKDPEARAAKARREEEKAAQKIKEIEEAKRQKEEKMYVDIGDIAEWVKQRKGAQ